MEYNKSYFEKIFSTKRMERYGRLYNDEKRAIAHYQCNIELAESFYPCLSILEVALRNALSRELEPSRRFLNWQISIAWSPYFILLLERRLESRSVSMPAVIWPEGHSAAMSTRTSRIRALSDQ